MTLSCARAEDFSKKGIDKSLIVCYNTITLRVMTEHQKEIKMDIIVIVLAVLYLCGKNVGTALAIATIIEIVLLDILILLNKKNS